jgi:hypothetical protein
MGMFDLLRKLRSGAKATGSTSGSAGEAAKQLARVRAGFSGFGPQSSSSQGMRNLGGVSARADSISTLKPLSKQETAHLGSGGSYESVRKARAANAKKWGS